MRCRALKSAHHCFHVLILFELLDDVLEPTVSTDEDESLPFYMRGVPDKTKLTREVSTNLVNRQNLSERDGLGRESKCSGCLIRTLGQDVGGTVSWYDVRQKKRVEVEANEYIDRLEREVEWMTKKLGPDSENDMTNRYDLDSLQAFHQYVLQYPKSPDSKSLLISHGNRAFAFHQVVAVYDQVRISDRHVLGFRSESSGNDGHETYS